MADKMEEQIYIIPLRGVKRAPGWKRSNVAIKDIRKFLTRHMKSEDVKLDKSLPFLGTLLKKEQDLVAYADQITGGARWRS